jgi:hypothetical protein
MSVHRFLSLLPPLLAIVGFIVYYVLKSRKTPSGIQKEVIDKIRVDSQFDPAVYKDLTPQRAEQLLANDVRLRNSVGKQNYDLFKQALHQEFIRDVIVYVLVSIIFVVGIIYFVKTLKEKETTQAPGTLLLENDKYTLDEKVFGSKADSQQPALWAEFLAEGMTYRALTAEQAKTDSVQMIYLTSTPFPNPYEPFTAHVNIGTGDPPINGFLVRKDFQSSGVTLQVLLRVVEPQKGLVQVRYSVPEANLGGDRLLFVIAKKKSVLGTEKDAPNLFIVKSNP